VQSPRISAYADQLAGLMRAAFGPQRDISLNLS
jgi:hypothetical protein